MKYLFLRGIAEYNGHNNRLLTDMLLSFTYIPGTVGHISYGSVFHQTDPSLSFFNDQRNPIELKRGIFIKLSYLIRS
ncbi:MAG: hypothetical protein HQ541_19360 [Mariniphaga sp.]|nr:hypothetical protein [Mariniphaga sp.]